MSSQITGSGLPPSGGTMTGPILEANGSAAAPSYSFSGATSTGIYSGASNQAHVSAGSTAVQRWFSTGTEVAGTMYISGSGGLNSNLVSVTTDAANILAQKNVNMDQLQRTYAANGAYREVGVASELLTIAAAASTDTVGSLLPANAYIEAVTVRVVTAIPTAATFTVGDATTAARFASGVAVAAGTTAVGLTHVDQTGAAGPKQTSAAKIRITPNLTPGAATGQVRISVFYRSFTPATS